MSMFDTKTETDDAEPDDELPYRQVGRVGTMPFSVPYDWHHIVTVCDRARRHLEAEGAATDDVLASGVDLDHFHKSYVNYDKPRDAEARAADCRAVFYWHVAPALSTHDAVEWRGGWGLDLEAAPATADAFADAASTLEIPRTDRTAAYPRHIGSDGPPKGLFWVLRDIVADQGRPVSSHELATHRLVPDLVDERQFGEALEYLAQLPGVTPPRQCAHLGVDDAPSWVYLPADVAAGEEVAHA